MPVSVPLTVAGAATGRKPGKTEGGFATLLMSLVPYLCSHHEHHGPVPESHLVPGVV